MTEELIRAQRFGVRNARDSWLRSWSSVDRLQCRFRNDEFGEPLLPSLKALRDRID